MRPCDFLFPVLSSVGFDSSVFFELSLFFCREKGSTWSLWVRWMENKGWCSWSNARNDLQTFTLKGQKTRSVSMFRPACGRGDLNPVKSAVILRTDLFQSRTGSGPDDERSSQKVQSSSFSSVTPEAQDHCVTSLMLRLNSNSQQAVRIRRTSTGEAVLLESEAQDEDQLKQLVWGGPGPPPPEIELK